MLGELAPLSLVTWECLLEYVGFERLVTLADQASLIGLLNWTMLLHVTELWQQFADQILPRLSKRPRRIFVDIADPKKRNPGDLLAAPLVLKHVDSRVPVTLGLNLSEADQVAKALGISSAIPLRAASPSSSDQEPLRHRPSSFHPPTVAPPLPPRIPPNSPVLIARNRKSSRAPATTLTPVSRWASS